MTETLIAGVAAQQCTVSPATVLEWVRHGIEDVAQRALGIELTWHTFASLEVEDLPRRASEAQLTRHFGRDGLDYAFVERRWAQGEPGSAQFGAESKKMRDEWEADPDIERYNPAMDVGDVRANFPSPVPWTPEPVSGLRVGVALSRWALYGGGKRLDWLAGALTTWTLEAADALNADCGFVALGERGLHDDDSHWEYAHRLSPARRDLRQWLWGFGWGTLLGPTHVATLGGLDGLRPIAERIIERPDGRVWVELGPDPASVPTERLEELERQLGPVLRRGDSIPSSQRTDRGPEQ